MSCFRYCFQFCMIDKYFTFQVNSYFCLQIDEFNFCQILSKSILNDFVSQTFLCPFIKAPLKSFFWNFEFFFGKILYLKSIICPASKLHITVLVIKREPCDVNLTRGLENTRRNVGTAPSISHHHIGREGAIKLLISTATISVFFSIFISFQQTCYT